MRALIQRVSQAAVAVEGEVVGRIGFGCLILLGVGKADTETQADLLARKTVHLRIFPDSDKKMNLSLKDVQGEALVVSQFTLYADTRKGHRPAFTDAAGPEVADRLYQRYVRSIESEGIHASTGRFGAMMQVSLVNDGPVTLLLDV